MESLELVGWTWDELGNGSASPFLMLSGPARWGWCCAYLLFGGVEEVQAVCSDAEWPRQVGISDSSKMLGTFVLGVGCPSGGWGGPGGERSQALAGGEGRRAWSQGRGQGSDWARGAGRPSCDHSSSGV